MDVVARCVRGVEWIVAAEARGRLAASVDRVRHREVWLHGPLAPAAWTTLRTADDVFLLAGAAEGIGHTRNDLRLLARAATGVDWARAATEADRSTGGFDVVASALGRRNYNRFEVEQTIGEQIAAQTAWTHRRRGPDRAPLGDVPLTVRVHIEDDEAMFGVRLADRPLHRREWKQRDTPGTLHPPVAAAMGLVAGLRPGLTVSDPFCGSGTIGIEVALDEPAARIVMSDLDRRAVQAASHNARAAKVGGEVLVARADGALLPLRRSSVDRLVANTPWGRAVRPAGRLQGGWTAFAAGMAEVLADRGRSVLLVDPDELAALAAGAEAVGCRLVDDSPLAVAGAWVTMVVLACGAEAQVIDTASQFGTELAGQLPARGIAPAGR